MVRLKQDFATPSRSSDEGSPATTTNGVRRVGRGGNESEERPKHARNSGVLNDGDGEADVLLVLVGSLWCSFGVSPST